MGELTDWQQRVVIERAEVYARWEKLDAFLRSGKSMELHVRDGQLLAMQALAMRNYWTLLDMRIERFNKDQNHG